MRSIVQSGVYFAYAILIYILPAALEKIVLECLAWIPRTWSWSRKIDPYMVLQKENDSPPSLFVQYLDFGPGKAYLPYLFVFDGKIKLYKISKNI